MAGGLGIAGLDDAVLIGRGGSGLVYRAHQSGLDRDVAVKIIATGGDDKVASRFARERRALGRLSHVEGVVAVYDAGVTESGDLYLLMPYLAHGSLRDQLDDTGPLEWDVAAATVELVAHTMAEVHDLGIIHRDLKPGNILLAPGGRPQVADFGIARLGLDATGLTTAGLTLTPSFSPPEGFDDGEPTRAGDVYSLGATLWALIAGRPPFTSPTGPTSMTQLVGRIVSQPPGDLRDRAPDALCQVIEHAMAKEQAGRPSSMRGLAGALAQAQADAAGFVPAASPGPAPGWGSAAVVADHEATILRPPKGGGSDEPVEPARAQVDRKRGRVWLAVAASLAVILGGAITAIALSGGGGEDEQPVVAAEASVTPAPTAVPSTAAQASPSPTAEVEGIVEVPTPTSMVEEGAESGFVVDLSGLTEDSSTTENGETRADGGRVPADRESPDSQGDRRTQPSDPEASQPEQEPSSPPPGDDAGTQPQPDEAESAEPEPSDPSPIDPEPIDPAPPVVEEPTPPPDLPNPVLRVLGATETTAHVNFIADRCVTASWTYSGGGDSGAHRTSGWPDASAECYVDNNLQAGQWTPALLPGTTYTVSVTIRDEYGQSASGSVTFTTDEAEELGDLPIPNLEVLSVTDTTAHINFIADRCVTASWSYSGGTDTGGIATTGWPDPSVQCYVNNNLEAGVWTPPLLPATEYTVTVRVRDFAGQEVSNSISFTTDG